MGGGGQNSKIIQDDETISTAPKKTQDPINVSVDPLRDQQEGRCLVTPPQGEGGLETEPRSVAINNEAAQSHRVSSGMAGLLQQQNQSPNTTVGLQQIRPHGYSLGLLRLQQYEDLPEVETLWEPPLEHDPQDTSIHSGPQVGDGSGTAPVVPQQEVVAHSNESSKTQDPNDYFQQQLGALLPCLTHTAGSSTPLANVYFDCLRQNRLLNGISDQEVIEADIGAIQSENARTCCSALRRVETLTNLSQSTDMQDFRSRVYCGVVKMMNSTSYSQSSKVFAALSHYHFFCEGVKTHLLTKLSRRADKMAHSNSKYPETFNVETLLNHISSTRIHMQSRKECRLRC